MDTLIIIPGWIAAIIALWFLMSTIDSVLNIWLFYMRRRLENMEATTSSTVCTECASWKASGAFYCADCGADLDLK